MLKNASHRMWSVDSRPCPAISTHDQDVPGCPLWYIGSEESLAQGYISAISLKYCLWHKISLGKQKINRHFCRFVPTVYLTLYLAFVFCFFIVVIMINRILMSIKYTHEAWKIKCQLAISSANLYPNLT